jgi:hypothetical protein
MNGVHSAKARWAYVVGLLLFCMSLMAAASAADPTWKVGVTISSLDPQAGFINLNFGVDPAASGGLDGLDVQSPPATPCPHCLDAFFLVAPYRLWTDMRLDEDVTIVWRGAIVSDSETFFITWDPTALPDTGNFMFNETLNP